MELRNVVKDKKFWFASFLIAWAAALQGHMSWVQRQETFKQKFANLDDDQSNHPQNRISALLRTNQSTPSAQDLSRSRTLDLPVGVDSESVEDLPIH